MSGRNILGADPVADQLSAYAPLQVCPAEGKDGILMICRSFLLGAEEDQG